MASSKGKAKDRPKKRRITGRISRPDIRSRVRSTRRKRANTAHRRQPYGSVSIPQLVYELLAIDKYNQGNTTETKRFQSPERLRTPRRRIQKYHERQRLPYEVVDRRDSPESVQVPGYAMESRPTSIESLTESMDAANNSACTSSANSSVSNISKKPIALANSLNSARALFRKKSLVRLINNYIKAGIEEGKRQAKKYIRKALSFGVRSGYLIPADRRGNVLHVCPTLDSGSWSTRRADVESRRRRRIERRGEMRPTTIDDRKAMRRGIPRGKPRLDVDRKQMRSRRRPFVQSPARNVKANNQRKSPDESVLREKNKPKIVAKRKSKINNKRGQQRKRGDDKDVKKSVKRRRTTSSSRKHAENNQFEPIEQSYTNVNDEDRNQYKSNEDNCEAITERRKSTSRQEDGLRVEKQKAGTSVDDDCTNVERKNTANDEDDDDEKSDEGSVEHNTNSTIREENIRTNNRHKMTRIKRHRNARSHQRIKSRRRKPNIPELIYKFLVDDAERALSTKCRCYSHENACHDEVVDSADTSRIIDRNMGYRAHKDSGRISKTRGVKRPTSRNLPISYLQKCVGGEDPKKARTYIKKALDFAVECGYLIPSHSTYNVLHVSSDLMKSEPRTSRNNTCDRALSKEDDGPTRPEDFQVQEQRRRRGRRRRRRRTRGERSRSDSRRRRRRSRRDGRRRRRRRSRSRSRSLSRVRISSPQSPEEVAEDEANDYEMDENDRKSIIHSDDTEREPKTTRSNQPDEGQSTKKTEENTSDLSVDEDETDDEEEKKKTDITKI
ncbi:uncharacterized protein [Anoplolepis gracilipes]|uniref:uncharacterized protein n=1 Tax=Anoplolepis gracilipes TaxID=354296 RepID=UPI003BA31A9C